MLKNTLNDYKVLSLRNGKMEGQLGITKNNSHHLENACDKHPILSSFTPPRCPTM